MNLDEANNARANAGDYVVSKLERSPEEYLEDRVEYKINQYGKKAEQYRNFYWVMAVIAAAGAALVPALINIFIAPQSGGMA